MTTWLLLAEVNKNLFLLPLAIAISLVYSASRYELPEKILRRALRLFTTIMLCMGAVLAVLTLLSWNL